MTKREWGMIFASFLFIVAQVWPDFYFFRQSLCSPESKQRQEEETRARCYDVEDMAKECKSLLFLREKITL